jgi:hypothetical protein
MAADLVESPPLQQTFVHDLESFSWVLLWIVLTQVKTGWDDTSRSSFLRKTFTAKEDLGREKKMFLKDPDSLDLDLFHIPGNTTLPQFLYGLKKTVSSRYDKQPIRDESSLWPRHWTST